MLTVLYSITARKDHKNKTKQKTELLHMYFLQKKKKKSELAKFTVKYIKKSLPHSV